MRLNTKAAVAAGVGSAILIGGVAAAVPRSRETARVLARRRPRARPPATARRPGAGSGVGCDQAQSPAGTLTSEQKATLASIAEQEKLSRDLYTAFAARYHIPVFTRIAAAETSHLDAIRTALAAYGVADPTAGKAAERSPPQPSRPATTACSPRARQARTPRCAPARPPNGRTSPR